MKRRTARRRSTSGGPNDFTFVVNCGFSMQFTFPRKDVNCDPANIQAAEVKEEALQRLEEELQDYLGLNYAIDRVECDDFVLLGTDQDDVETAT